jgi:hypothetical protein
MALQAAVVAGGFWIEWDMAHMAGRPPSIAEGLGIGGVAAFAVTAAIVVIGDALRKSAPIGRPNNDSGQLVATRLPSAIGKIDQSSKQRGRLNTADGDAGKAPKLLR